MQIGRHHTVDEEDIFQVGHTLHHIAEQTSYRYADITLLSKRRTGRQAFYM
jgi:hypothetical protein